MIAAIFLFESGLPQWEASTLAKSYSNSLHCSLFGTSTISSFAKNYSIMNIPSLVQFCWRQNSSDKNNLLTHFSVEQLITCCSVERPKNLRNLVRILKGKVAKVHNVICLLFQNCSILWKVSTIVQSCAECPRLYGHLCLFIVHNPNLIWIVSQKTRQSCRLFSQSTMNCSETYPFHPAVQKTRACVQIYGSGT